MSTQVANEPATLTEAILGKELITAPIFSKVRAWPAELRAALFSVLLASGVLLPYLGAVGLWDPCRSNPLTQIGAFGLCFGLV